MSNFTPVSVEKFVRQYMQKNEDASADTIRVAVHDALAAKRQGVRCACGNPLWVAGSAVAGYGCFTCISGSAEPDGDPEIVEACEDSVFEAKLQEDRFEDVGTIIRNHPWDYVEQLEAAGFTWYDDEFDMLYEEETKEASAKLGKAGVDGCFYWYVNNWHYHTKWDHFKNLISPATLPVARWEPEREWKSLSLPKSDAIMARTISMLIKLSWTEQELADRLNRMRSVLG